jgi:ATP-dependent Clp protease ATP-binding subunit ClpC
MFERYTERARRALFFARYEVTVRGATSIDTEHLLLGLIREPKGLITRIFEESSVSPATLREAIEARLEVREPISASLEIPFSAEIKRVLQYAAEEADSLGHSYIGVEHLLLGLLRQDGSVAAAVLTAHGVGLRAVRVAIVKLLQVPPPAGEDPTSLQAFERIGLIRRLVQELEQLASDSGKARRLAQEIDSTLSALMRQFPP